MDGEYLLTLARQKTAQGRATLAATISDLFSETGDTLSDRERSLMYDILHKIIADVERTVRRNLSERLSERIDVPVDLVRYLAQDEVEIAYPVLTRSQVLRDEDLIEVVRHRTLEHQLAVAMRYSISEEVSEALVATGQRGVIETLLNNVNAKISQQTLGYLVEQSQRVDSFREPIIRRSDLSPKLAKRMFLWVSAAMRAHLITKFQLDETTIDGLLEEAAMAGFETDTEPDNKSCSDKLAQGLADNGMVTPDMLLRALAQGEISLFASMFASMTGLRRTLVMRLFFEDGGEGMAIACKAIGIDRDTFSTIFTLSRNARPKAAARVLKETREALDFFDKADREATLRVLRRWQRNPDYLAAIRQLDLETGAHGHC